MPTGRRRRAFTLVDLLVLIAVFAVLLTVTPATAWLGRRNARQMQNNTQLRGIHQGIVVFAQGNKANFPGLDAAGEILPGDQIPWRASDGSHTGSRFVILLDSQMFYSDYLINPNDKDAEPFGKEIAKGEFELPKESRDVEKDTFDSTHYSHAGLDISEPGPRREEWSETINTFAPVMADRNTGPDVDEKISSVWTKHAAGEWHGSVVFNDNHVKTLETPVLEETRFDDAEANKGDHLFKADGKSDALMTFLKEDKGNEARAERDQKND